MIDGVRDEALNEDFPQCRVDVVTDLTAVGHHGKGAHEKTTQEMNTYRDDTHTVEIAAQ